MDPIIFLITSTTGYGSLACKIHEIFAQTINYTKINKKTIQDTETKDICLFNNKHLILKNYENNVTLRVVIFRPLKYTKHKILNLEIILLSILMSKFFRKQGKMPLTGNAHADKTKPVLMYIFSDVGICSMLLCRRRDIQEISLDYERQRMSSNRLIS